MSHSWLEGERDADAGPSSTIPRASVKRKRTARATLGQVDTLLALLEARPYLHTRKFTGLQGRENYERGWKEVAEQLNAVPNAATKTPEQWITVWRDMKSRACTKASKLRQEIASTGNRGVYTAPLTEMEQRITSIVGVEYTTGTDCPDAMPEEDLVQQEMEAGEPISEVLSLPQSHMEEILVLSDDYEIPTATPTQEQPVRSATPRPTTPNRLGRQRGRVIRNLNPRQSVAVQHSTARREFLAVAETNSEAMRMLAAATQAQAEASRMQAEAAKVQAEALLLFAQAANKIADAITSYTNKHT